MAISQALLPEFEYGDGQHAQDARTHSGREVRLEASLSNP